MTTAAAPKDGKCIIARFKSYPVPMVAVWNKLDGQFVAAMPQCCGNDSYFENELIDESDLMSWRDVC